MGSIASQIISLTIVYSIVYSDADQRKHQSSASLAFVRGIHWWPVNFQHKGPVTRKMFPFDDVIIRISCTGKTTSLYQIPALFSKMHLVNAVSNGEIRCVCNSEILFISVTFHRRTLCKVVLNHFIPELDCIRLDLSKDHRVSWKVLVTSAELFLMAKIAKPMLS